MRDDRRAAGRERRPRRALECAGEVASADVVFGRFVERDGTEEAHLSVLSHGKKNRRPRNDGGKTKWGSRYDGRGRARRKSEVQSPGS